MVIVYVSRGPLLARRHQIEPTNTNQIVKAPRKQKLLLLLKRRHQNTRQFSEFSRWFGNKEILLEKYNATTILVHNFFTNLDASKVIQMNGRQLLTTRPIGPCNPGSPTGPGTPY